MSEEEQADNANLKGRVRTKYIQVLLAAGLSLMQNMFAVWSGMIGSVVVTGEQNVSVTEEGDESAANLSQCGSSLARWSCCREQSDPEQS